MLEDEHRIFTKDFFKLIRNTHTGKLIERPISYGSTHLRGSQTKMGSTDLELTGACFVIKKLDCWSHGVKFLLIPDHKNLT